MYERMYDIHKLKKSLLYDKLKGAYPEKFLDNLVISGDRQYHEENKPSMLIQVKIFHDLTYYCCAKGDYLTDDILEELYDDAFTYLRNYYNLLGEILGVEKIF